MLKRMLREKATQYLYNCLLPMSSVALLKTFFMNVLELSLYKHIALYISGLVFSFKSNNYLPCF